MKGRTRGKAKGFAGQASASWASRESVVVVVAQGDGVAKKGQKAYVTIVVKMNVLV